MYTGEQLYNLYRTHVSGICLIPYALAENETQDKWEEFAAALNRIKDTDNTLAILKKAEALHETRVRTEQDLPHHKTTQHHTHTDSVVKEEENKKVADIFRVDFRAGSKIE